MAWSDIETAIRAWVKSGSGLTDEQVIWADQNGGSPALPFIDIRLGELVPVGAADASDWEYDAGGPAGQEIVMSGHGVREFAVSVRAFSASPLGNSSARALLSKVQTALALESARSALHAAGVTPFDNGRVQVVPAILETSWEGRAVLQVRFYTEETVTERTTYIDTVEVTNEEPTPDQTFQVTIE